MLVYGRIDAPPMMSERGGRQCGIPVFSLPLCMLWHPHSHKVIRRIVEYTHTLIHSSMPRRVVANASQTLDSDAYAIVHSRKVGDESERDRRIDRYTPARADTDTDTDTDRMIEIYPTRSCWFVNH